VRGQGEGTHVYDRRRANAVGVVSPFEYTHHPSATKGVGMICHKFGEPFDVVQLECEFTEWIAGECIETGRNENEIRDEVLERRFERSFKTGDIFLTRQSTWERDIPHVVVRPTILGGTGAGVPGPLVHGQEADIGIVLHQCLRSVAVVHVPIGDQHARGVVVLPRIVRADRDVTKQTESHGAVTHGVMAWRTDRAKAARVLVTHSQIDRVEYASRRRGRRVPRPFARDRIVIESAAAGVRDGLDRRDVCGIVRQRELVRSRVTPFAMLDLGEEIDFVAECARDGAQAADMFRVSPPCVVPPAVGVRDERDRRSAAELADGAAVAPSDDEYRPVLRPRFAERRSFVGHFDAA